MADPCLLRPFTSLASLLDNRCFGMVVAQWCAKHRCEICGHQWFPEKLLASTAEAKLRGRCHSRAGRKIRSFHSTLHQHHALRVPDRSAEMSADMSTGKAGHLTRRSRSCFPPLPRHSFAGVCRLADGWRVGFSGFPSSHHLNEGT